MKKPALRGWLAAALCALAPCALVTTPVHAQAVPARVQAPHHGDVLFRFFQDQHFEAVGSLMVSQHFQRLAPHDDEAEVLRGGLLLAWGMHIEAGEIFARLIEHNAPVVVRDRAWFFLARIRHQRGLLASAEEALSRITQPLPGELEEERTLLAAQLRLLQGDFAGAAARLQAVPAEAPAGPAARFNLGVALVKAGDAERGNALLDALGRATAGDDEQRHLRDRANLALGFAALATARPDEARGALQRVRLNGPLSNKALLGFGWAAAEKKAWRDALVPWSELLARDGSDAAVLEARIALPYAMAELGALRQSLNGYEAALAAYAQEQARLDAAIAALRSGAMVEALLQHNTRAGMTAGINAGSAFDDLGALPPAAAPLAPLLAGHDFQEAFKSLRDLQFLQRHLAEWQSRLGVFGDMLATRREAFEQRLPAVRERTGATQLPAWQQRRDALAAELAAVEAQQDSAALANAEERALLARIARVEAALAASPDAESAERLRRVKGALTWQLARDFPARLWDAKKALRQTDGALAAAVERDVALVRAQSAEPARFAAYGARITALAAQLQALQPRVAALGAEQQTALQEMAVAELQAQQQRLTVYATQARLAIAQLHDRAQLAARTPESSDAT